MNIVQAYLFNATKIIDSYQGDIPFAIFIKNYFRQHKKFGRRDRKAISLLCFSCFRLGNSLKGLSLEEQIKIGLFLCSPDLLAWEKIFPTSWQVDQPWDIQAKLAFVQKIYPTFSLDNLFPLREEVSKEIDILLFSISHFVQPDLFIRCRPGKEKIVEDKLAEYKISFTIYPNSCMALPASTKLDSILQINRDAVIQDFSSQQIQYFLKGISPRTVWDCCAGSGGKSILAKDVLHDFQLYVSDTRESILHNLQMRFFQAGILHYHLLQVNLAKEKPVLNEKFDLLICDAPCSGSGTWGRSPEQLTFFTENALLHYAELQKKIIQHTISQVSEHGYFLYITCSVFKKENEDIINFILYQFPFSLKGMKYFTGYEKRADTMFAALLQKK